jgi:hypothetical protein
MRRARFGGPISLVLTYGSAGGGRVLRHVRLRAVLATVGALAVLAGCGGGGDSDVAGTTPTATAPAATAPPARAVDPRQALLTLADVPAGWTQTPDEDGDDDGYPICSDAIEEPESLAEAEVAFASPRSLPAIGHAVAVYPDGVAERFFADIRERLAGCPRFTQSSISFTLAPLAFPPLGDESFATVLRFEPDESTFAAVLFYARVGPAMIVLSASDPGPPAVDEAERYARLAVQRLEDAAGA